MYRHRFVVNVFLELDAFFLERSKSGMTVNLFCWNTSFILELICCFLLLAMPILTFYDNLREETWVFFGCWMLSSGFLWLRTIEVFRHYDMLYWYFTRDSIKVFFNTISLILSKVMRCTFWTISLINFNHW